MLSPVARGVYVLSSSEEEEEQQELELEEVQQQELYNHEERVELDVASRPESLDIANLLGTIECAYELEKPVMSHVKVSYVEPGPRDRVMFRSKQVVHETEQSSFTENPSWNSAFQYELYPPQDNRWENIEGDLLFTLFDSHQGQGNRFIGQVVLPLQSLVRQQQETIQVDGMQVCIFKGSFPLQDRIGAQLPGFLSLHIRLELPSLESHDIEHLPRSPPKAMSKKHRPSRPKPEQNNNNLSSLKLQRRVRERQYRQLNITRENRELRKRLQQARKPQHTKKTSKPPTTQVTDRSSQKKNELLRLTSDCDHLKHEHVHLEKEIAELKASLAKNEVLIKKQKAIKEEVERATRATAHQELSSARQRMPSSSSSSSFGSSGGLKKLQNDVLRVLEQYNKQASKAEELYKAQKQAETIVAEKAGHLQQATQELEAIRRRKDQTIARLQSEQQGDDQHKEEHDLRIEIAVAETFLRDLGAEASLADQHQQRILQQLSEKLARKTEKARIELEKQEKLRETYNKLKADWKGESLLLSKRTFELKRINQEISTSASAQRRGSRLK